jgi:two-component system chemotaxis sensor kinase CheA
VRVDTERLDEIMNLVGELVLVRNRLSMLRSRHVDDELGKAISSLALVTSDLQTAVMKTRMQPVKKVFNRFPRVIRDLSRSLGKEIDLEIFGEDTDLDKNLVEALSDPLVHLVRNAVDHGIESPEVREAAGKPRKGKVILGAAQEGDHIALVIKDDGGGMDPQGLRRKAVEKGLMEFAMAERMSDREAFNVIFMAGFSTKSEISDVSGRGVGMDVVKTRISQLNGTVEIDSEVGVGTTLRVKLPLTLAILPALMVILDGRQFAIPLASVSEILDLDLTRTHYVDEQEVIIVRNQALPIHYVKRWLNPGMEPEARKNAHVVVVHAADRKVGLVVDGLVGQEEVVIKPLGQNLQGVKGLAGATITGDGGIALILDVSDLVSILMQQMQMSGRPRRTPRSGGG